MFAEKVAPSLFMERLAFVLLLVGLALTTAGALAGEQHMGLQLELSFKEPSFSIPGEVTTRVEFKNLSSETIVLNTVFNVFGDCELNFRILTPSGKTPTQALVLQGKRPSHYSSRDFKEILPGKTYQVDVDLAQWFQLNEEGIYKVRVEYSNRYTGSQLGTKVWTGQTKSPTRTFQLIKSR